MTLKEYVIAAIERGDQVPETIAAYGVLVDDKGGEASERAPCTLRFGSDVDTIFVKPIEEVRLEARASGYFTTEFRDRNDQVLVSLRREAYGRGANIMFYP